MSSKSLLNMSASLSAEGYSELALGSLAVNRPLDGCADGLDDLLADLAVLGLFADDCLQPLHELLFGVDRVDPHVGERL
jgi:hypothetical protein